MGLALDLTQFACLFFGGIFLTWTLYACYLWIIPQLTHMSVLSCFLNEISQGNLGSFSGGILPVAEVPFNFTCLAPVS